jgi:hypothetical protein
VFRRVIAADHFERWPVLVQRVTKDRTPGASLPKCERLVLRVDELVADLIIGVEPRLDPWLWKYSLWKSSLDGHAMDAVVR